VLLLLTIGLVIVALALLIVGFVQHALTLIYFSIACSAAAALTLIVFSRLTRRRSLRLGAAVPAELTAGLAEPAAGGQWGSPARSELEPFPAGAGDRTLPGGEVSAGEEVDAGRRPEVSFPIEDYDDLRSSDIVPLLGELEPDELLEVRDRELAGRGRRTVLRRIDSLLAAAGVAPPPAQSVAASSPEAAPVPGAGGRPATPVGATPAPGEGPITEAVPEPAAEDAGYEEPFFPIADYDELRAAEILPLLPQLYPEELEEVAERERAGANRATVLNRISRLLAASSDQAPLPPAAAPGGAPGSVPGAAPALDADPEPPSPPATSSRGGGSRPAPKVAAASKATTTRRASTARGRAAPSKGRGKAASGDTTGAGGGPPSPGGITPVGAGDGPAQAGAGEGPPLPLVGETAEDDAAASPRGPRAGFRRRRS
jgi:hypothetical protein